MPSSSSSSSRISATASSVGPSGAAESLTSTCQPGAGSAARSSLPFLVTGSASITTNAPGTMCAGSRSARCARSSLAAGHRTIGRHDVGDEARVAAVVAQHDRTVADRRVAGEHRGDLVELDAVTADLHLLSSSRPRNCTCRRRRRDRGHRCGTSVRRLVGERIGDEPLGGQLRPVQVADRDAAAADEELARLSVGNHAAVRSRTCSVVPAIDRPMLGGPRRRARRRRTSTPRSLR